MPAIDWRHNRERLLLPTVVFPGFNSRNPTESVRIEGLFDTGATGTGIRRDIAETLMLRPKGQRRVYTANGMMMATEYVIRIGFVCGDYTDPSFQPDARQPYVLDKEMLGFELQPGFAYPLLVGMDIIGAGDLAVGRDGRAKFVIG